MNESLRRGLKRLMGRSVFLRRRLRCWRLRKLSFSWSHLSKESADVFKKTTASSAPHVLVATGVGAQIPCAMLESGLALALKLRGAEPHVLLCDKILPACQDCTYGITIREKELSEQGPRKSLCNGCFSNGHKLFKSLGVKIHLYSDYLSKEDEEKAEFISKKTPFSDIKSYSHEACAVGEHAMAGALRFYAASRPDNSPYAENILRRYFKAALLTAFIMKRFLEKVKFQSAVFHHGIYIPQGIVGEVCRKNKVSVVNWNPAYRKNRFIFSHQDTYHRTMMSEVPEKWEKIPWNDEMEADIMQYLHSRWEGKDDWIHFHKKPFPILGGDGVKGVIDFSKPSVGILTNVLWDAQLHYPANIFPNMLDWLKSTLEYFSLRSDLQIIIRIHPAEITGGNPSRQKVADEIQKMFPILPSNFIIVKPEVRANTYALMAKCNAVVIYGTKTGVEITSMGIPAVVAGEAWIRNKGITHDPKNREEYFKILKSLPFKERLSKEVVTRARKYAYHFFFRRMIPLSFLTPLTGWPLFRLNLKSAADLMPGRDKGLDLICEGILKGSDFIFPAEGENNNGS